MNLVELQEFVENWQTSDIPIEDFDWKNIIKQICISQDFSNLWRKTITKIQKRI